MKLRDANINDIPALRTLEQAVVTAERPFNSNIKESDVTYYDLEHLLDNVDSKLIVIEDKQHIIACGYCQIRQSKNAYNHDRHGYLGFMYVDSAYRGKGLNKDVMQHLMAWAQTQHIRDFYLDVYAGNNPAIKAYRKLGFQNSLIEMKLHLE